ncbi:D-aspartate oxidase [Plakobranchus ocellatus]|uniref:D-aspartate oxidase n=1 Tax=Plakobranchus ocellatus TaxID=259542 RepID=A0AAV3ZAF5_9GAST|nr:D-aspartate oxidase [Plakobranchus ocellatus]
MFTTVIIEGSKYLPWLTERFITNGGRIIQKKVNSFDELSNDYDLVMNCAGLGGGKLASDPSVQPVRGHLIRVSAPWIKYFIHTDDTHYFLPQSESAAIGGTRQLGRYDLVPEIHESERILREMEERLPPLKGAKILHEWVGLRPYRKTVRVEAEVVICKGKQLKVIHNYGHGAFGVSLSWGTALYAAELAQQALNAKAKI